VFHLDFAGVDYISSAGLRVLVMTHRQLAEIRGALAIRQPSKEVSSI
jgi:anti-anti-sigma factor